MKDRTVTHRPKRPTRQFDQPHDPSSSLSNRLLPYALLGVWTFFNIIFYPADFVFAWVIAWVLVYDELTGMYAAFLGGLLIDILLFNRLGATSIILLLHVFCLLALLRLRIARRWYILCGIVVVFLYSYTVASGFVRFWSLNLEPSWWRLLANVVIAIVLYAIFVLFFGPKEREPLRLRLN